MSDDYAKPGKPVAPPPKPGFDWPRYNGRLLIIWPRSYEAGKQTRYGERDVVRADIMVVDTGEQLRDVAIFPYYLVTQLRDTLGGKVLGRLGQDLSQTGKSPWILFEATDADIAQAKAFEANGHRPLGPSQPVQQAQPVYQGPPQQQPQQAPQQQYPQAQPAQQGQPYQGQPAYDQGQPQQQPAQQAPQQQPPQQQWPQPAQQAAPQAQRPW
jgi:hypothetical protein